ncbi:MAG: hypothetical protein LAT67_15760, partial [Balneolales bacterium]|nr:hypothetical protein [Balneolales bacterium]
MSQFEFKDQQKVSLISKMDSLSFWKDVLNIWDYHFDLFRTLPSADLLLSKKHPDSGFFNSIPHPGLTAGLRC